MSASREAFDLFHPACRRNFRDSLRRNWKRLWWWKLVLSDTINRVCSSKERGYKPALRELEGTEPAIKPTHEAADAFWTYWRNNGETHRHGYYESTWGAINAALRTSGVVQHKYGSTLKDMLAAAPAQNAGGQKCAHAQSGYCPDPMQCEIEGRCLLDPAEIANGVTPHERGG